MKIKKNDIDLDSTLMSGQAFRITKELDKFVANFVRSEKIIPLTYEIVNNM